MSPYLSPKNAIAPIAIASSLVVSNARTGALARISRLARISICSISSVGHRGVVAEVEAQSIGPDERAGLLDVLAEDVAERVVEDVRAGVVAAGGVAPLDVDRRSGRQARRDLAGRDAGDVAAQTRAARTCVSTTSASPVSVVIVPASPT